MIAAALVIGGVEHERQRHLERRDDFERVELELERRLDPAHHRRDPEPRRNLVIGKVADDFDALARETDFLLRFAQRGLDAAFIAPLNASTGKTDLAGMVMQMRGALR